MEETNLVLGGWEEKSEHNACHAFPQIFSLAA